MKLIKILKYKGICLKVFDYGSKWGSFPYEYSFKIGNKVIKDRTSHSSIESCINYAKQDIDTELKDK